MKAKEIISIIITFAILLFILVNINLGGLKRYFSELNLFYLFLVFLIFIPLLGITKSERWRAIAKQRVKLSFKKSLKLIFIGFTLNSILPSKLGDFIRAHYLWKKENQKIIFSVSTVILEKIMDIFSIFLIVVTGLLFIRRNDFLDSVLLGFIIVILLTIVFISVFLRKWLSDFKLRKNLLIASMYSIFFWFLSISEIYFFFICFGFFPSFSLIIALVPLSILIGMLPISLNGIGVRDSALIFLLMPYMEKELIFGVGLLITLNYLLMGLAGVVFTQKYIKDVDFSLKNIRKIKDYLFLSAKKPNNRI